MQVLEWLSTDMAEILNTAYVQLSGEVCLDLNPPLVRNAYSIFFSTQEIEVPI